MGLQREMAGVQQLHHRMGVIGFIGMSPRRDEKRVVNQKYLDSVRYDQSNFGDPRNVTASVSWKF